MRRIWSLSWLCVIVLLFAGCHETPAGEKRDGPPSIPPPSSASADPVAKPVADSPGDVRDTDGFHASGTAMAVRTSQLSTKASGVMRSIKVREGDRVKAGQLLCVLDAANASLRSEAAAADHAQAVAALEDAKRDLDRVEQLADAGALPEQTMDKAQLAMRVAELRAEAAAVGVRMARKSLADATLRAPFDGVISKVLSEEGQYVTVMPPSPVFTLVDTSALELRVHIPERKIAQISVGMPVQVELPAVGETRNAKVDRMAEVIDPATRSAEVIILLDNPDRSLPAGLFARVVFPSVRGDDAGDSPVPGAPASSAGGKAQPGDGR